MRGAYTMQLTAYITSDNERKLAYAFIPAALSDGVDEIVGYTSWIDYVKDNPGILPRDKRAIAREMDYETEFHKPSSEPLNTNELHSAIARLLSTAIRDKSNENKATWQESKRAERLVLSG
jgi:hypothetical protein